jgi:starvation-inducible DNA-binding protein
VASSPKQAASQPDVKSAIKELTAENTPSSPVVEALSRQVANGFVLYTNYKHYHWNTYGPLFRDLHKLFDKFAEEIRDGLDELAERIRMIGQNPPSLPQMLEIASVAPAIAEASMREMIEEANRHALVVISEIRQGVKTAEEHDDPGTVDLFSKLVQVHEKQEWWLRELLKKRDGLGA